MDPSLAVWSGNLTMSMAPRPLAPRFDRPDFVGRLVRDLFIHLMDETSAGIATGYDNMTPSLNQVMVMIDRDGSRITELAARAGVTKQSMAETVAALESRGLVTRRPDPTDGRAKLVLLTEEGWTALRFGLEVVLNIHDRWEALLGPAKMSRLMKLLRELVDALDAEGAAVQGSRR